MLKALSKQLTEAFIAKARKISELKAGMIVQVMIRGKVQKVGVVTHVDPKLEFATVEDWWMRGKFTDYDGRYSFYEVPPPREVVFAGEQKTEAYEEFPADELYNGMLVTVRSKTSGQIVCSGKVIDVNRYDDGVLTKMPHSVVKVLEMGDARKGDMAQEFHSNTYQFYVWVMSPIPSMLAPSVPMGV